MGGGLQGWLVGRTAKGVVVVHRVGWWEDKRGRGLVYRVSWSDGKGGGVRVGLQGWSDGKMESGVGLQGWLVRRQRGWGEGWFTGWVGRTAKGLGWGVVYRVGWSDGKRGLVYRVGLCKGGGVGVGLQGWLV